VIAVIGGLITALAWALATIAAARAARVLGAWSTSAWVISIGFVVTVPLLLIDQPSEPVTVGALGWLALAGAGYVVGMVLNYTALSGGKIPVAAPIVSTEGAIAATMAVLSGESASPVLVLLLGVLAVGIFAVALQPGGGMDVPVGGDRRYVGFAIAAAIVFGVGLFASGRAASSVPASWVVAAGRIAGVIFLVMPLLLTRRIRFERALLPVLLFAGIAEVVGVYTFAWAATDSIAIAAVLSSQFAVIAALIAHTMGERISGRQWVGVATVTSSVAIITLSRL